MSNIYRPPSGSGEWLVVSGECKIQMAAKAPAVKPAGSQQYAAKAPAGGIIVREGFRAQDPSATYHGGIAYPGGKFIPRVNSPKKKRPRVRVWKPSVRSQQSEVRGQQAASTVVNFQRVRRYAAKKQSFFSHAERVILEKVPDNASPEQVRRTLLNNGVKPDEMKFGGIDSYLSRIGGSVSKNSLLEHIRSSGASVIPLWRAGREIDPNPKIIHSEAVPDESGDDSGAVAHTVEDRLTKRQYYVIEDPFAGNVYIEDENGHPVDAEKYTGAQLNNQSMSHALDAIREHIIEQETPKGVVGPAKYHEYQLPGGDNYRELLLTLPDRGLKKMKAIEKKVNADQPLTPDEEEFYGTYAGSAQAGRGENDFRAPHWDEPNVLAHIRMNDRVGPNGEKLLHVEELQSDWHQAGRQHGYQGVYPPIKWEQPEADKAADFQTTYDHPIRANVFRTNMGNYGAAFDRSFGGPTPETKYFGSKAEAVAYAEDEIHKDKDRDADRPPDAPFKKTWHELALRHIIDHAAKNGYDGISWTPGQEQADRYDLSQHVSGIAYDPKTKRLLTRQNRSDDRWDDLPGKEVESHQIEDYIGKDAAERLFKTTPDANGRHVLKGSDLKVGGEGMKGFYDRIVPQYLNHYGKKFGAQVVATRIGKEPPPLSVEWQGLDEYRVFGGRDRIGRIRADSPAEAQDQAEAIHEEKYKESSVKTIPYFPITPALRKSVKKEGQVLYARRYSRPPATHDFVDAIVKTNRWEPFLALADHANATGRHALATLLRAYHIQSTAEPQHEAFGKPHGYNSDWAYHPPGFSFSLYDKPRPYAEEGLIKIRHSLPGSTTAARMWDVPMHPEDARWFAQQLRHEGGIHEFIRQRTSDGGTANLWYDHASKTATPARGAAPVAAGSPHDATGSWPEQEGEPTNKMMRKGRIYRPSETVVKMLRATGSKRRYMHAITSEGAKPFLSEIARWRPKHSQSRAQVSTLEGDQNEAKASHILADHLEEQGDPSHVIVRADANGYRAPRNAVGRIMGHVNGTEIGHVPGTGIFSIRIPVPIEGWDGYHLGFHGKLSGRHLIDFVRSLPEDIQQKLVLPKGRSSGPKKSVAWRELEAAGFKVHRGWEGRYFHATAPNGDVGRVVKQHGNAWHWFWDQFEGSASGGSPEHMQRGSLGDVIDSDQDVRRYTQLLRDAPEEWVRDSHGAYRAASDAYNQAMNPYG